MGSDDAGCRRSYIFAGGWDPKYRPNGEKTAAEVVNLGYVLNVIEDPAERVEALCGAWQLAREVMVVAALIERTVDGESARLFNDGVLTRWNTFQKIRPKGAATVHRGCAGADGDPLALGIFVVFRDPVALQDFMARRARRRIDWGAVGGRLGRGAARRAGDEDESRSMSRTGTWRQPFWQTLLERGRLPIPQEFAGYGDLVEKLRSARRALRLVLDANDEEAYEQARMARRNDLLCISRCRTYGNRFP